MSFMNQDGQMDAFVTRVISRKRVLALCGASSGIAAIAVEYIASLWLFVLSNHWFDWTRTVSDLGALPQGRLLFGVAFSLAAVLFLGFGLELARHYHLTIIFKAIVAVGVVAQVLFSWLPDAGATAGFHVGLAIIVLLVMVTSIQFVRQRLRNAGLRGLSAMVLGAQLIAITLTPVCGWLHIPFLPEVLATLTYHLWMIALTIKDILPTLRELPQQPLIVAAEGAD